MLLCAVALAAGAAFGGAGGASERPVVAAVIDGDTIALRGGARVRLVQIDAPEVGTGQCYSRASARELRRLLPVGSSVRLVGDPLLDRVDRYGRLLRYVFRGSTNANVALVRRGAATVYFYGGVRGRFAGLLNRVQSLARRDRAGMWGACDSGTPQRRCDPSYPSVCIPPPPPDLDCADVSYSHFRVLPPDPHHFDGSRDGEGCEA